MKALKTILFVFTLISGAILAITPNLLPMGFYTDKILHMFVFGNATIIITYKYLGAPKKLITAITILILIGLSIEIIQSFVPERMAEPEDIASNIIGILYGFTTGYLLKSARSKF